MGVLFMYDNLGKTFSNLRSGKKIPVKSIINDGILSESQYYRFINQDSDIGLTKFMKLLDNLNIQFEEFFSLLPESKEDLTHIMSQISTFFNQQNGTELKYLNILLSKKYLSTKKIKYHHLSIICECLQMKLTQNFSHATRANQIVNYLKSVDNWTHYELVLFANTFFVFQLNDIALLLSIAKKKSKQFKNYQPYTQESIRLHSNIIIYLLEKKETDVALKTIQELEQFKLKDDYLYEKVLIKFWKILGKYIENPSNKTFTTVQKLIDYVCYLECNSLSTALTEIANYTKELIE